MFVTLALAGLFAAGTPAVAEDMAAKDDQKICRRVGQTTGTRLARSTRVCKTKAEWEAFYRQSREDAREMQDTTNVRMPSN
ncbi:hypothetical protein [Sphingomonas sp.]|uniref:hypothetical protein n=1 Tax=Sphingomonas sp. TaxID=28214 RepID=UPI001ED606A2|nr:hypothetical protein [Sphingomonas sp.]MBX3593507.1 hypothetical protein [Sphingomonas sp.]